jgi:hypothetical protein
MSRYRNLAAGFAICFLLSIATVASQESETAKKHDSEAEAPVRFWGALETDEFKSVQADFQSFIKEKKYAQNTSKSFAVNRLDQAYTNKNTDRVLFLMISPSCSYCYEALIDAVQLNAFNKYSVYIRYVPEMSQISLMATTHSACNNTKLTHIVERLGWSHQLFGEKYKKYSANDRLAAFRSKAGLTQQDALRCSPIDDVALYVDNIKTHTAQCHSVQCMGGGYLQIGMDGAVWPATAPGTPTWFVGEISSDGKTFVYSKSGVGAISLKEELKASN